jgi:hypothetical protein
MYWNPYMWMYWNPMMWMYYPYMMVRYLSSSLPPPTLHAASPSHHPPPLRCSGGEMPASRKPHRQSEQTKSCRDEVEEGRGVYADGGLSF